MERLSNSYQELLDQVLREFEIPGLKDEESLLIAYSEMPWFPGGQFCISIVASTKNNQLRLIKQQWDNEYDLNRFSSGVYNLNRLCIKRTDMSLSASQQTELKDILNSITQFPITLDDETHIVLDGVDYELTFNTKNVKQKYHWNVPTNDIKGFEPLLSFLSRVTSGE